MPQNRAPSIPIKKPCANSYTGTKEDKVGPGCYNTNIDVVKQKAYVSDF